MSVRAEIVKVEQRIEEQTKKKMELESTLGIFRHERIDLILEKQKTLKENQQLQDYFESMERILLKTERRNQLSKAEKMKMEEKGGSKLVEG